jgi:glyoxylase-like metal-dependent hydrolase (beta-lactamase superfamily II)
VEPFELYAIRYASGLPRTLGQNVLGGDPHEMHSALDFFVWVARRSDRVFMIDTGMGEETAKRRGDGFIRAPADAIGLLGLDAARLEDVILTHIHYDHAGMLHRYPRARFHLQDTEMAYATGRCMCAKPLRRGYEIEDVVHLVRCVHADRVVFHDQSVEITNGLSVHRVGGHTGGQQVVRVWTQRGWVVVASDASHLYWNMQNGAPFPSVYRVDEMVEGFRTVHRLAGNSWDHVIPGHDPLVMELYAPPSPELDGIVARLDVAPRRSMGG